LETLGPYLSERQWGTVREDYSAAARHGNIFSRSCAVASLSMGEDGIGGISDRHQMICFGLAMWNGRDSILKERLFGLNGTKHHGEDVKSSIFIWIRRRRIATCACCTNIAGGVSVHAIS